MTSFRSAAMTAVFLAGLLAQGVSAQDEPTFDWSTLTPSTNLNWVDCYNAPFQCTRFNVPLNYSNPSAGTATLALLRLPATVPANSTAYRGPVLFNPGGPGLSGIVWTLALGQNIQNVFGSNYDVVSFDPRGMANSVPKINLFKSEAQQEEFNLGSDAFDMEISDFNTLPQRYAKMQKFGDVAKKNAGNILKYMTTDNVARDMLSIVKAHGEEKLQFWGISYGTVIGATYAALFPDKIERMVLDGNEDVPNASYSLDWRIHVVDADKALDVFFKECSAAGSDCPFSSPTAAGVKKRLDALLARLQKKPAPVSGGGNLTAVALKGAILGALQEPAAAFAPLADALKALEDGNSTAAYAMTGRNGDGLEQAIVCTDGVPVTDSVQDLKDYAKEIRNTSEYFSSFVSSFRLVCSGWDIHPNNFKGPIEGNTSFPIMFIGNSADPVTPLVAAHATSEKFPGSKVLEYNIPGHTSFAWASACVIDYVNKYFNNGTLPADGALCDDADIPYFSAESGAA
jgi:pimeloyl-ACP methyl ester carboxylesterase